MRTQTVEIFKFAELSDDAKERAREWFRSGDEFDSSYVYEDAATVAELFGLDLRTRTVRLMNGTMNKAPCIYYSGFYSQGDGACFEGAYEYKPGGLKAVIAHAPQDSELHSIVKRLQEVQRKNFYCLSANTSQRGHYQHSGCMVVDVFDSRAYDNGPNGDAEEEIRQCLRDFADWIYRRLRDEYEYRTSDEAVDESILANEYEFHSSGAIA